MTVGGGDTLIVRICSWSISYKVNVFGGFLVCLFAVIMCTQRTEQEICAVEETAWKIFDRDKRNVSRDYRIMSIKVKVNNFFTFIFIFL